jgi:hypothetical protein
MSNIPDGITEKDVRDAMAALDRGEPHDFGQSTGYDLVEGGMRYPPKAVLGLAARRILERPLGPYDFKGGEGSQCFRVLRRLGFDIERKANPGGPGEDWTEDEIREAVQDYFSMLRMEREGKPYSKAEHNHALRQRVPGRSKGSIEYKYQNVSGVLFDEGFPFISGYKPARNYQRRLLPDIVLEYLGADEGDVPEIERIIETIPDPPPAGIDFVECEVAAPKRTENPLAKPRSGSRRARRFDFAERDAANRKLGKAGEEFILRRERWYLNSLDRGDLAARIEWVSQTQGDGLGYDIVSYDSKTSERIYIEVKTTNCDKDFPFYASQCEIDASIELGDCYRLYRVFNFSLRPQFYQVGGDLRGEFRVEPRAYQLYRL